MGYLKVVADNATGVLVGAFIIRWGWYQREMKKQDTRGTAMSLLVGSALIAICAGRLIIETFPLPDAILQSWSLLIQAMFFGLLISGFIIDRELRVKKMAKKYNLKELLTFFGAPVMVLYMLFLGLSL